MVAAKSAVSAPTRSHHAARHGRQGIERGEARYQVTPAVTIVAA